ncbi:hypothetical protein [Thermococcus sp.]
MVTYVNEVLPPDIRKGEGKSVDEYLSEGFNLIISNPKILFPFVIPLIANILYGVYLLEHFFRGLYFTSIQLFEVSIPDWRHFLMMSILAVIIIVVFMLWGIESIAYFVIREQNISEAISFGVKRLPVAFVNYIILLLIISALFVPVVIVHSLWLILPYSFLIAILVSPLIFLLSPVIIEKTFGIVDAFVLYKGTFRKSLILGLLYSLVSSVVGSLIPIVGGVLNVLLVIPGFVATYSLLYRDYRENGNRESGFISSL